MPPQITPTFSQPEADALAMLIRRLHEGVDVNAHTTLTERVALYGALAKIEHAEKLAEQEGK